MLKKYIGPGPEVEVIIRGVSFGALKPGESIPVPDELAASVSWPESNWEDVKSTGKSKPDAETSDTNENEAS